MAYLLTLLRTSSSSRSKRPLEPAFLPINHNTKNNPVNLQTETIDQLPKTSKQPSLSRMLLGEAKESKRWSFSDLPVSKSVHTSPPLSLLLPILLPSGHKEGLAER
jgi:hypothetical protein